MYREQATFYTDQYAVYTGVIPSTAQHKAITKHARKTNHDERFGNTMRRRVSRLVRDTLAFSKKLANHIGALNTSSTISNSRLTLLIFLCDHMRGAHSEPLLGLRSRVGHPRHGEAK